MKQEIYQRGKFYTLPIVDIRDEGDNSFFIVNANGKEYAIRMFDIQKSDPAVLALKQLPCMVKEVHDDSIVFVQNFARMFSSRYLTGEKYTFIVNKEITAGREKEHRYYDVRDIDGIPFVLKCARNSYLTPRQRITCSILRPNPDKLILELYVPKKGPAAECISAPELLRQTENIAPAVRRYILCTFSTHPAFDEARQCYGRHEAEWVVKAITSVPRVETWKRLTDAHKVLLLTACKDICLFLLEDSDYLLQFSEAERENYREWIVERIAGADTYLQCLTLIKDERTDGEIDRILRKIKSSGYIYHPQSRMQLLIAIFSMQPELLERKIDSILDLVQDCAHDWRQPAFYNAFSGFLKYYIDTNREPADRIAVVDDEHSRLMLNRMVRSICFMLLMSDNKNINTAFYRSMLYHYLSFRKSDTLVEQAFTTLLMSDDKSLGFTWSRDIGYTEIFAYRLSNARQHTSTFLTRSLEGGNVRFTVSADGITISRSSSGIKDKNVLPEGFPGWHNLRIFLDSPSKYTISRATKSIRTWRDYWAKIELALFENRQTVAKAKTRKVEPEVGTVTYVRVLWKDDNPETPNRFYCRIEDDHYEGEGYIDSYLKGGSTGMFHYDPMLDFESFLDPDNGKPLIFKVRVNSIGSPKDEVRTYTFDCMSFIDEMFRDSISYGDTQDSRIIYQDARSGNFLAVTRDGYGIFLPFSTEYGKGDFVKVSVTDATNPKAIQGDILGPADDEFEIRDAATSVILDYAEEDTYEESEEELEEESMTMSEDLFELDYIEQIINIIDHKAVLESDNVKAYAYLAVAHILARMIGDEALIAYLHQRLHFICILDDYAANGRIDDRELKTLGNDNGDIVEKFPLLNERLIEMRIVNCFGIAEKNPFLWEICNTYEHDHILARLSRLMLSYNLAEGFGLFEHQRDIIGKIKDLLNVNVELPVIYSFGEEDQITEFKTSVVFPPDNNMRADIRQQTYNIMRVICGMVNSYGGTVYLGVNNTGTACGLENDLKYYLFEGSTDKYDLYIRNEIRAALGNSVNASVTVEHPDAGKHYIYAIKVRPSKTPVALHFDNVYYNRQGSSTYPIALDELTEIMNNRDFSRYNTEVIDTPTDTSAPAEAHDEEKKVAAHKPAVQSASDEHIATSALRKNIVENWQDGYGSPYYLRIQQPGDWCLLTDLDWNEGILELAVNDDETDGSLVIVYDDGSVNKVPIAQLTDKTPGKTYKMYNQKRPIFISPARKDAALLTGYEDDRGRRFLRLDDIALIDDGKMLSSGNRLTDVEFDDVFFCEVIGHEHVEELRRMHNLKRSSLGFQAPTAYGQPEHDTLLRLGLSL